MINRIFPHINHLQREARNKKRRGFTLVELLVVIAIIAVLSAAGLVSYTSATKRARDGKRKSDLEELRSALVLYRTDVGYYPNSVSFTGMSPIQNYISTTNMADPKAGQTYSYRCITSGGGGCRTWEACANLETQTPARYCVNNP